MTGAQASYLKTLSERCGEPETFSQTRMAARQSEILIIIPIRRGSISGNQPASRLLSQWVTQRFCLVG
jgi:Protein of unknown function (DUF3072)